MRILLNGVGRIGKAILQISLENKSFQIVAINELNSNIENIAYSINYDSTYGRIEDKFVVDNNFIQNKNSKIEILNFRNLEEIVFKSFSDILSLVSGTYYPPRSKKVINLINRVKKSKFTKSTLGGCIVEEKDNFILISKELKIRKVLYQPQK